MTITVPAQEVRSEYDTMMNEYAKQARIDGFRKGHVPVPVLERKFGASLKTDAMARVIEKALETALKDVSRPLAYEMPTLEDDQASNSIPILSSALPMIHSLYSNFLRLME